jgi:hypothetical protein
MIKTYTGFADKACQTKRALLGFLINAKKEGKTVVGYGAAAKGNTLLNYAGIKPDLLSFVCDAAESKQTKFMPGSHIPILKPKILEEIEVDYVVIFPWNISNEIRLQNSQLISYGVKFVTAVPELIFI